jgi:hypothetical protein
LFALLRHHLDQHALVSICAEPTYQYEEDGERVPPNGGYNLVVYDEDLLRVHRETNAQRAQP